jgi:hypothetical protein
MFSLTSIRIFQKYNCSDQKERTDYTNKIFKEVLQMEQFFKKLELDEKVVLAITKIIDFY